MSVPSGVASAGIPGRRQSQVDAARQQWIRRLTDVSRRNNLLYFRELKTGTLDLSDANTRLLAALVSGQPVVVQRLFDDDVQKIATSKLKEIRRRAVANLEERGLETLFLALGAATWAAPDDGRPADAPIVLVPLRVEAKGRESLALQRVGDIVVNPVLVHVLNNEYGCMVSATDLLGSAQGDEAVEDEEFDLAPVLERLIGVAAGVPGFAIQQRAVVGNFSFQKMAMVKDLQDNAESLAGHDIIAAIAGDLAARNAVLGNHHSIDPKELDDIPPEQEYLVFDSDSSQRRVIEGALRGQSGVIQGPPGTGKSQTIANLITSLSARGRRVLFVAEKRAALNVVLDRLNHAGLQHLALDLHGADVSRRQVIEQLEESLRRVRDSTPVDADELHRRFVERRHRLNAHVVRLHALRQPSGLSVYQLQGLLLRHPQDACSETRWRGTALDRLTPDNARIIKDLLGEAVDFGTLFTRADASPWQHAQITSGTAAQQAIDLVVRIAKQGLPTLGESIRAFLRETGLPSPESLGQLADMVDLVSKVGALLRCYDPGLFMQGPGHLLRDFGRAKTSFGAFWGRCFSPRFRKARRTLRTLRTAGPAKATHLFGEVSVACELLTRWQQIAPNSVPTSFVGHDRLRERLTAVFNDLEELEKLTGWQDLKYLHVNAFWRLFEALANDTDTPRRLPRLREIETELERRGVPELVGEIRSKRCPPATWPSMFDHAWWSSCLDRARAEDPALAAFSGRGHQQLVEEFKELDRERLEVARTRVGRAQAERAIDAMNRHADQKLLVRRETQKKTRHLPIRRLLREAPDVLTALRPCWMASPLSVSQLLAADRRYFDVVIFDEASQVLPEDAAPALLRASQTIVAGDRHQLPPTAFFAGATDESDEDEEAKASEGFESLLDLMSSFLDGWTLDWHYRSKDESLIAFSNHHIYGDRLVTFPGPAAAGAISHALVQQSAPTDAQEESSGEEVERVVELVLEHAQTRPHETLGVIAMGIKHANRIQMALDRAVADHPELDPFFDENRKERFFVKNLERVQGDERDAIILSVGYGKDRSGKLPYRFGPLLYEGGHRRLNVAVTRARQHMTLVSSFAHHDMDPRRSRSRGVELLRHYLEYAASQGRSLGDKGVSSVPLNPFEQSVFDTLSAKGIGLVPQWGASKYRIDMVARHPHHPGRFVLAIECDGAAYHSVPAARDRDRLRQEHLEALGWRFCRIWSTDWFLRRDDEITRVLRAYDAAVRHADEESVQAAAGTRPDPRAPPGPPNARGGSTKLERRGSCPVYTGREKIDDYEPSEIDAIIRWMESDGRLRTDDEIVAEAVTIMGFLRRGNRIEAAIQQAIARVHGGSRPGSRAS